MIRMNKIDNLLKEIHYLYEHYVEIGILAEDKNRKPSGKQTTILEYAIYNEFGTSKMPARPFFRIAINENEEKTKRSIRKYFNMVLIGIYTGEEALKKLGEEVRENIIKSIQEANNWATPLSPLTLKAKFKKRPDNNRILIDDKYLIRSIRFKIVNIRGGIDFISGFKEV